MTNSANFAYRTSFVLYVSETTQYSFVATKIDLAEYMDGVRGDLLWKQTSDDTVMLTLPDAEMVAFEPTIPEGQAAARFTEAMVVTFLSSRPYQ